MHLTQSHSVSKNNKLFELLDFLSWQSNALANQTIYTLRQPLTYVDNIRQNKVTHEQQLVQIDALNHSLKHHLYDRYIKSEDKSCLAKYICDGIKLEIFPDEYQTDPYPLFLNETHGFVGKDLLQYHMKNLPAYQTLYSQSSQQVLHQILNNFQSYWKQIAAFKQKKITHFPKLPYYREKVSGRNVVFFSNQQIKREGKYIVLTYMGDTLRKYCKETKNRIYSYKQILSATDIKRMTDKNGNFYLLKKNQKIVNENEDVYLETTVHLPTKLKIKTDIPLEKIAQVRLVPAQLNEPIAYQFEIVYERQIDLSVPNEINKNNHQVINQEQKNKTINNKSTKIANPLLQTWFDMENNKGHKVEKLDELNSKKNKDIITKEIKQIKGKKKIKNHDESITSFNKIEKSLSKNKYLISHEQIYSLLNKDIDVLNKINIAAIDPGMKRLFALTFKAGDKENNILRTLRQSKNNHQINKKQTLVEDNLKLLQPIIYHNDDMLAFNQYSNKISALLQEKIKKEYGQDYCPALRKLDLQRKNKLSNWLHHISSYIVEELKFREIDLLVIGKNISQKQEINIGKKNNQKFVQIPFNQLWERIAYKAYQQGILVCYQEESYTSQSSCLLDDIIPIYKEGEQANHVFAGIRDKGLYKHKKSTSQDKVSIHADVNGSYNIMKKFLQKHQPTQNKGNHQITNKINNHINNDLFAHAPRNHLNEMSHQAKHHLFVPISMKFADIKTQCAYYNILRKKALQKPESKYDVNHVFQADRQGVASGKSS